MSKVFLGSPTYDGFLSIGSAVGAFSRATAKHQVIGINIASSLLASSFNRMWATAINNRVAHGVDYFAMLHADVEPQELWLDILIDEMLKHDADVMSVVIPIKDTRGVTSTAVGDPEDPFSVKYRITMTELESLPDTFCAKDLNEDLLLVNTGCWVCRFDKMWDKGLYFTIRDKIVKRPNGLYLEMKESEDWFFSRLCHEKGFKVMATKKVAVDHVGTAKFSNRQIWGWEKDRDAKTYREAPKNKPLVESIDVGYNLPIPTNF